jgi:hypothetical protein
MRELPLRQGHMDGLCGVYAILNFCLLKGLLKGQVKKDAEWYVFEAVEMEGLLTSYYLVRGFEVQHLHAVFERLSKNLRLSYKPYYIDELYVRRRDHYGLLGRVFEKGGAVIGGFGRAKHWVLFHELKKSEVLIHDSAADDARKQVNVDELAGSFSSEGIALMPSSFRLTDD